MRKIDKDWNGFRPDGSRRMHEGDVLMALSLGDAEIVARYLYETSEENMPDLFVCHILAYLLDPNGCPLRGLNVDFMRACAKDEDVKALSGAVNPDTWFSLWRLEFKRNRRKQSTGAQQFLERFAVGYYLHQSIKSGVHKKTAIDEATNRFKCSKAYAYSVLKMAEAFWKSADSPEEDDPSPP
jgi:hypothetical protein